MNVLTTEEQATDELLMSYADAMPDPNNTRRMLEWALNSGNVAELNWALKSLHELTEAAAEILDLLGPERNNARYRGAMLRLDIALNHPYTGR